MKRALRAVVEEFGLGELIRGWEAGGTRNRSFHIMTTRGRWVARLRYEGYSEPERVAFDHAATCHLAKHGIPVCPPIQASDCQTFWRNEHGLWEMFEFAGGRNFTEGSEKDLVALSSSLARFHAAGREFEHRHAKLGPRGETDPEHLLETATRILSDSPEMEEVVAPYHKSVMAAAKSLTVEDYDRLPHTLIHGDVQPANLRMDNFGVSAFLDLDWCAWRPRIYDVCFALLCCCTRHEKPVGDGDVWLLTQSPEFDTGLVRTFLDTYQRSSTWFTEAEKTALIPQLILSWCHVRLDNSLKVPLEDRRHFLEREPMLISQFTEVLDSNAST